MKKLYRVLGVTVALVAATVSSAGALAGPGMLTTFGSVGTGSNTAAAAGLTGIAGNLGGPSFSNGTELVNCPETDLRITSTATSAMQFTPGFGPTCVASISGTPIANATIDSGCGWTMTFGSATFNDVTASGSGATLDIPCSPTITLAAIGCTIRLQSGKYQGASLQNISDNATNNVTPTPWGMKLTVSATAVQVTNIGTCFAAGSTGSYTSGVYIRDLWGMV